MSAPRHIIHASSVQFVLEGTEKLVTGIDQLLGMIHSTAFPLLKWHATRVIVCSCDGCQRGRELAAGVANILIENAKSGLWPKDLIDMARAFNKGQPVEESKIQVVR